MDDAQTSMFETLEISGYKVSTPYPLVELYNRMTNRGMWVFYGIALILIVIEILIYYQGVRSEWFRDLDRPMLMPRLLNFTLWFVVYIIAFVGNWVMYRTSTLRELPEDRYFSSLLLLSIILSFIWVWMFFILRDPHIAVLYQAASVCYHLWYFNEIYKYSKVTAMLQLPLLLWMIYIFINTYLFTWLNPDETIFP